MEYPKVPFVVPPGGAKAIAFPLSVGLLEGFSYRPSKRRERIWLPKKKSEAVKSIVIFSFGFWHVFSWPGLFFLVLSPKFDRNA